MAIQALPATHPFSAAAATAGSGVPFVPFALVAAYGLGKLASLIDNNEREPKPPPASLLGTEVGPGQFVFGEERVPLRLVYPIQRSTAMHLLHAIADHKILATSRYWIDDEPVAVKPANRPTSVKVSGPNNNLPGVLVKALGLQANYRPATRRMVMIVPSKSVGPPRDDTNRQVPEQYFADYNNARPTNTTLRNISWIIDPVTFELEEGFIQIAFGADQVGGFPVGPHLRQPGDFSLVMRNAGRTFRVRFNALDDMDPHVATLSVVARTLLQAIGTTATTWDIALIKEDLWPTELGANYSLAFSDADVELDVPTGELVQSGPYKGGSEGLQLVQIFPYFEADGRGGQTLRRVDEQRWTDNHRLDFMSYVHIQLNQRRRPANEIDENTPLEDQYYLGSMPRRFEAQVKGLTFKYPGGPINDQGELVETFTNNTAAIRYWILRNLRGVSDDDIDIESVIRAVGVCSQQLTYRLPNIYEVPGSVATSHGGYSTVSQRYSFDGVFEWRTLTDLDRLEAENDLAMMGGVQNINGKFVMYAGENRPPKWRITAADIVADTIEEQIGNRQQAIDGVRITLAASRDHDYKPLTLYPELVRPDRRNNIRTIGPLRYIKDPLFGLRLQRYLLNRELNDRRIVFAVTPGSRLHRHDIQANDVVALDLPHVEAPASGRNWVVENAETTDDWTIRLSLAPELDYDSFGFAGLPPLVGRGTATGTGPYDHDRERDPPDYI